MQSAIDIDLWTARKAPILDSEPIKPNQIQLVKDTTYDSTNLPVPPQTSGKLAPKGQHSTNKGKRKSIDHKTLPKTKQLTIKSKKKSSLVR